MVFDKKYNILVSAVCGLGTALFFIPFLKALRIKFPNSKISLLTWENNNVFAQSDFIDEVVEVKHSGEATAIADIDLYFELKINDDSIRFLSKPSVVAKEKYIIIPNEMKWGDSRDHLKYFESLPINDTAKNYLFYFYEKFEINDELDVDALLYDEKYLLEFKSNENQWACLCLGNWSNKYGLIDVVFLNDLIDQLMKKNKQLKILLIGKGKDEQKRAQSIIKNFNYNPQFINLVNSLTMQKLIKIFLKSNLIIGQDTGVVHLASCLAKDILLLTNNDNFNYPVSSKNNHIQIVPVATDKFNDSIKLK